MTQRYPRLWLRLAVTIPVLWAASVSAVAASLTQQELAQAGPPRFLRRASASRALQVVDIAVVPILRRRVTLDRDKATLGELLQDITRQSGMRFAYNADSIPMARIVGLRAASITVGAALTEILLDAQVDVWLKSPTQAVLLRRSAVREGGTLVGRVHDAKTGRPIAGVDILLNNRVRGTSDTLGRYRVSDIEPASYTLAVRRVGYARKTRQVTISAEREDTVDFTLEPAAVALNELIATATGPQRRRDLGNAITTLRADSLLRSAPIHSLTDLLDGRVPGMTLRHTTGAPGDPAKIRLRGLGSVMRSNDPVFIVDGVRVNADQSSKRAGNLTNLASLPGGSPQTNNPAPSPLDQIDPNIIEKIEVFKGPSAATLYGADAANGVFVITTKRGKAGPTQWNASFTQSRTTKAGDYPLAYFRWGHLPFDGNQAAFCPLTVPNCVVDSLIVFQALNDPDLTVIGNGRRTGLSLTASGGTAALTYSLTGSFGDELGQLKLPGFEIERFRTLYNREPFEWMLRPHRYKTWGVTSNVNARLGTTADITLTAQLSSSDQQRGSLESLIPTLQGAYLSRTNGCCWLPARVNDNGGPYTLRFANPLANYYTKNTAGALTFTTGVNAAWRPRPWFDGSAQAGVSVAPRDDQALSPALTDDQRAAVTRGLGSTRTGTFNLQGALRKPVGLGFLFVTRVGANLNTENASDLVSAATGLRPGTTSLTGATQVNSYDSRSRRSVYGWYIEPQIMGQRISLSTGLRLDGSSNYGTRLTGFGGGGGGFLKGLLALPKLNGSWVVSEEPWFPFSGMFSSLRLRGAYGQAQVQPGPADRLRLYGTRTDNVFGSVLDMTTVGNSDLRPERSTEFEGGLDADLWNSRVSIELTAYRKMQVDALLPIELPGSVAGEGVHIVKNIGNIRNTGLEITASVQPIQTPLATWSVALNYSRNTNILTKLGPGVDENRTEGRVVGYPLGSRWAKPILGFADENGDQVISTREVLVGDSLVFMGRLMPAYTSSLSTNLELFGRTIAIAADFQYDGGNTQIDGTAKSNWVLSPALSVPGAPFGEQAAVVMRDVTDYGLMQTVSTFRFKSISVNYAVPKSVARALGAQDVTFSVRGSNLGLYSTYQGKDPDVNAWSPGEGIIDTGQLAQPRTWELAVFMRF